MRITLLLLPVIAIACTSASSEVRTRQRNLERLETAQPAGEPINCIDIHRIDHTRVVNDQIIDFEMIGNKTYRNVLPHACPGLGFDESFAYETSLQQLCSVDTITVLENTAGLRRGASCGLGSFQPISFPEKHH
jgi:hypothetical protein